MAFAGAVFPREVLFSAQLDRHKNSAAFSSYSKAQLWKVGILAQIRSLKWATAAVMNCETEISRHYGSEWLGNEERYLTHPETVLDIHPIRSEHVFRWLFDAVRLTMFADLLETGRIYRNTQSNALTSAIEKCSWRGSWRTTEHVESSGAVLSRLNKKLWTIRQTLRGDAALGSLTKQLSFVRIFWEWYFIKMCIYHVFALAYITKIRAPLGDADSKSTDNSWFSSLKTRFSLEKLNNSHRSLKKYPMHRHQWKPAACSWCCSEAFWDVKNANHMLWT